MVESRPSPPILNAALIIDACYFHLLLRERHPALLSQLANNPDFMQKYWDLVADQVCLRLRESKGVAFARFSTVDAISHPDLKLQVSQRQFFARCRLAGGKGPDVPEPLRNAFLKSGFEEQLAIANTKDLTCERCKKKFRVTEPCGADATVAMGFFRIATETRPDLVMFVGGDAEFVPAFEFLRSAEVDLIILGESTKNMIGSSLVTQFYELLELVPEFMPPAAFVPAIRLCPKPEVFSSPTPKPIPDDPPTSSTPSKEVKVPNVNRVSNTI